MRQKNLILLNDIFQIALINNNATFLQLPPWARVPRRLTSINQRFD